MTDVLRAIRVGDPYDERTQMGPLANDLSASARRSAGESPACRNANARIARVSAAHVLLVSERNIGWRVRPHDIDHGLAVMLNRGNARSWILN